MKALLVIDFQNGFLQMGDFNNEKERIENMIKDFKKQDLPVIFIRHKEGNMSSPIAEGTDGALIDSDLIKYADEIIEKNSPSAFFKTNLLERLETLGINHVFITGFNTEFCPQFTAIAAFDRGFKVTFIEDATATVNDDETYEFPGLDIRDFIGTVLHWSNVIEVLDFEEYEDEYDNLKL